MRHCRAFSIVIPTYKRPQMLLRSLNSVLCQLGNEDEVIVVNDDRNGGVDINPILSEYEGKVRVLNNQFEKGPSGARNFGVSQSHKPYVMFLDDDDVMQNGYLASVKASLERYPEAGYGGAQVQRLYPEADASIWSLKQEIEVGIIGKKAQGSPIWSRLWHVGFSPHIFGAGRLQ